MRWGRTVTLRSCFLFHGLQAQDAKEFGLLAEQNISRSLAVLVTSRSDINDPYETRAAALSYTGSIPHSLSCNSLTTDSQSDRKTWPTNCRSNGLLARRREDAGTRPVTATSGIKEEKGMASGRTEVGSEGKICRSQKKLTLN